MAPIDKLHSIERDWFGAAVPSHPKWLLTIDGDVLALRGIVSSPPICTKQDHEGSFTEGLWEADVVELFLANPKTGFYVEFNLSPHGAWWCCTFDSPRSRCADGAKPIESVQTRAAYTEEGWDSTMLVYLKSLPDRLAFDADFTLANITFCLGRPQQFITLADLGGGEPDFHRPDKWIPISKILAM
jgi:hypothetical protein